MCLVTGVSLFVSGKNWDTHLSMAMVTLGFLKATMGSITSDHGWGIMDFGESANSTFGSGFSAEDISVLQCQTGSLIPAT